MSKETFERTWPICGFGLDGGATQINGRLTVENGLEVTHRAGHRVVEAERHPPILRITGARSCRFWRNDHPISDRYAKSGIEGVVATCHS